MPYPDMSFILANRPREGIRDSSKSFQQAILPPYAQDFTYIHQSLNLKIMSWDLYLRPEIAGSQLQPRLAAFC